MVDLPFQPAWLTDELTQLLDALPRDAHHRKRRATILRLAEAAATGGLERDVWAMPECCSWKTWDGHYRRDAEGNVYKEPGWRDDPATMAALDAAKRRAQWWMDQAEARRMAKRMEHVAEAGDLLAEYAPHAARRLMLLMGQAGNEETRRRAANDILDRADEATASKGRPAGPGVVIELVGIDPDAGDDQD